MIKCIYYTQICQKVFDFFQQFRKIIFSLFLRRFETFHPILTGGKFYVVLITELYYGQIIDGTSDIF